MAIANARLLGAMIKKLPADISAPLVKRLVMPSQFNKTSVLGLNSVLLESPESLTESEFTEELPTTICQGIANKTVRIDSLIRSSCEAFLLIQGFTAVHIRPLCSCGRQVSPHFDWQ
jgi:hypothetical protein